MDYYFPIRGHSFLPADRVFARVEQEIRKKETIFLPAEYIEILEKHGVVHEYGKDWQCFDFKGKSAAFVKSQRSFKISEARVLQVHGDELGFKSVFVGEFCQHSLLKKEKKWAQYNPSVQPENALSEAGVQDEAVQDLEDSDEDVD